MVDLKKLDAKIKKLEAELKLSNKSRNKNTNKLSVVINQEKKINKRRRRPKVKPLDKEKEKDIFTKSDNYSNNLINTLRAENKKEQGENKELIKKLEKDHLDEKKRLQKLLDDAKDERNELDKKLEIQYVEHINEMRRQGELTKAKQKEIKKELEMAKKLNEIEYKQEINVLKMFMQNLQKEKMALENGLQDVGEDLREADKKLGDSIKKSADFKKEEEEKKNKKVVTIDMDQYEKDKKNLNKLEKLEFEQKKKEFIDNEIKKLKSPRDSDLLKDIPLTYSKDFPSPDPKYKSPTIPNKELEKILQQRLAQKFDSENEVINVNELPDSNNNNSSKQEMEQNESVDQVQEEPEKKGDGKIKQKGLYNTQINAYMKKHPSFKGCFARDEIGDKLLSKLNKDDEIITFIYNTDVKNGKGKHWRAVYINTKPDVSSIEHYDSFGEKAEDDINYQLKKIVDFLNPKTLLKYKTNLIVDQRADSSSCGFLCIKFLEDRLKGIPFKEVTLYNSKKMERKVKGLKKEIFEKFPYI
jgi:hypothetical protein